MKKMTQKEVEAALSSIEETKKKIDNTMEFTYLPQKEKDAFNDLYTDSLNHLTLDDTIYGYMLTTRTWQIVLLALEELEEYEYCQKILLINKDEDGDFARVCNFNFDFSIEQGLDLAQQIRERIKLEL
jgi:hypothetical protein